MNGSLVMFTRNGFSNGTPKTSSGECWKLRPSPVPGVSIDSFVNGLSELLRDGLPELFEADTATRCRLAASAALSNPPRRDFPYSHCVSRSVQRLQIGLVPSQRMCLLRHSRQARDIRFPEPPFRALDASPRTMASPEYKIVCRIVCVIRWKVLEMACRCLMTQ